MFRKSFFILICFIISLPTLAQSQPDILKDAVDPFSFSKQRVAFLRVAGADSEINQDEFIQDQKSKQVFARVYDNWATILKYDKNKNKSIDWFEASTYRRDLRNAVLAVYDTSKDKKLKGPERAAAIKDLAKKKVPSLTNPKVSTTPNNNPPSTPPDDTPATPSPRKSKDNLSPQHKKFDLNNDGKLDADEAKKMQEDRIAKWKEQEEKKMDTNGDGEVSLEERHAHMQSQFEQGRTAMFTQFDKNKDGQLDVNEKQAANSFMAQQMAEQENRTNLHHFDKDKDGKLSDEEQQTLDAALAKQQQAVEKRTAELLPDYDINNNGQLDSTETLKYFLDSMKQKVTDEHNGKHQNQNFLTDGKYDHVKRMISPDGINEAIIKKNFNFGELLAKPIAESEKEFELNRERYKKLQAGRENARKAREEALKKKVQRNK